MKKILILLLFSSAIIVYAQPPTFSKVYNEYSGESQANSIIRALDNKYIVAGAIENEALIYEVDSMGNILWTKKIGNTNNENFNTIISTNDSCYVAVGNIFSVIDSSFDIFCIKININGDTIWTKEINLEYDDYAFSVQQTYDNGYIIAGYSTQNSSSSSTIAVVKLDAAGNLIWGKTFTGGNYNTYAYAAKQMPDSGYVVIGYTDSLLTNHKRTFLMKLTPAGDISWIKRQNIDSANYTLGNDVMVTGNGLLCYLLANDISNNSVIMKTDFLGNVLWSNEYNPNVYCMGYNDIIIPRKLHSISDDEYFFISGSGSDIVKIDAAGNLSWAKEWMLASINDFLITPDKGFMIIGYPAMTTKTSNNVYYGPISIIKADSSGYNYSGPYCFCGSFPQTATAFPINMSADSLTSALIAVAVSPHPIISNVSLTVGDGCVLGAIIENKTDQNSVQIYPDPATFNLTIETQQKSFINIFNIEGQFIRSINANENITTIDVSGFSKGMYIIEVNSGNKISRQKFVKQ